MRVMKRAIMLQSTHVQSGELEECPQAHGDGSEVVGVVKLEEGEGAGSVDDEHQRHQQPGRDDRLEAEGDAALTEQPPPLITTP
jgi:hypothetical protein